MARLIIRSLRLSHCKRGPERCPLCAEMDALRPCVLDIEPEDMGMLQRRVIEVDVDGVRTWREYDVVRVFEDAESAEEFAAAHGIDDVML